MEKWNNGTEELEIAKQTRVTSSTSPALAGGVNNGTGQYEYAESV